MANKPTYEELEQRLKDLERISEEGNRSAGELRKAEIRYQKLFERIPVGLYRTTLGGEILDGNPALVEILGYPDLETLIEVNTKGIVDAEHHRQVQTLLEREGITHDFELRVRRRDGTFIWVRDTARTVRATDGSVLYYEGSLVDITERKQGEEKLKESEERYRGLVEYSTDAILMIDRERNIVHCNKAFLDFFGYGKGEVEGKSIRIIHKSDESFRSFGAAAYPIDEKVGYFRTEWEFMHKDGAIFPVETVTTQMRSLDGAIKSYMAVIRDITERKRMETQLQHTQKMEAVGTLAGGMAHEFNNLMTAVMSYSSFLLEDLGQGDPMRKDVEEIKKAGNRASSLVKQLLAFSRKQVLKPVMLDLNGVLTDKEEMLRQLIGEDVELKMALEHDLDKVKADQNQVEQVILNLTINAKDAMPEGGKLTIETANVEIDEFYVSTHGGELKPGPYVMLAMSDTGMGMNKETQSQIFEPFFTTKDTGEGTGLGLSTVYGIIKQSGGDIRVYSEPEKGTIFKIYLPRMEEDVESAQEADLQMERIGGSETVLLVEDNDLVRKVSRRVLEQYGYRVLEAEDGDKALMVSEQHEGLIELMVTDVVMPEMSGKELAERLQPLRPEMKVLYMSGYTDNAVIRRGVTGPDVAFLEKPFTPDVLAGKVRQVLDETEKRKSR